ncbi:unnamed protein product [Parascedosporium putredinis]|uniref:Uncharacterized protein n=1 Tax=Parascedosporium putredinis TaxID=1442378 RepID=A0A9P1GXK5_9PEZI|nr:unnamed protein product [Parascedosporium putredinis]CAI7989096.1 unnamed protein product [Parascedosporium putredinis]
MAGESGAATMIALPSRTQAVESQRVAPVNPGPLTPDTFPSKWLKRCIKQRELELPTAVAFLIVTCGAAVAFLGIAALDKATPVVVFVQGSLQLLLFLLAGALILVVRLGYVPLDLT